jgi:hypothetical protein
MCFVFKVIQIFNKEKLIDLGQREYKISTFENGPDFENFM